MASPRNALDQGKYVQRVETRESILTDQTTRATAKPARRRGVIQLHEEILYRILNLPEGQRIIGFRHDPLRLAIDVCVEGDGLPECPSGTEPYRVNAEPYTVRFSRWAMRGADLEQMVEVIAEELDRSADVDAGAHAADLRRVLAGTYDPRGARP